jgi:hypothetical protein
MRIGRIGRLLVTMTMAATALGSGTVVHGAPPRAGDDAAYYSAVARRIEQVRRAGGNEKVIDRMLEREFGWVKLAGGDDGADDPIALGTPSGSDVTINKASVYRNTQQGRFEAVSTWRWKTCGVLYCWAANYGDAYGNDGGPDGFGIVSSVANNPVTSFFATYTERGALRTYMNPDEIDGFGAGYSEQDRRFHARDFSWDHGTIMYGFNIRTCSGMKGTPWIFKSRMSHTWGDGGLQSVSLGLGVVNFTFANASPNKWSIYGNQLLYWYPCG